MSLTRYLKTKVALTTGVALSGALALSGTAHASDEQVIRYEGGRQVAMATSYGANGALAVCDWAADGRAGAAKYIRRNGAAGTQRTTNGVNTCTETSDIPSNPIAAFELCTSANGTMNCDDSGWVSTNR